MKYKSNPKTKTCSRIALRGNSSNRVRTQHDPRGHDEGQPLGHGAEDQHLASDDEGLDADDGEGEDEIDEAGEDEGRAVFMNAVEKERTEKGG